MADFVWITDTDAIACHDTQIAVHGGLPGIRDAGMLSSALARPTMKAQYGEADLSVLAAAYAFGIARNHPFLDGNKRTALVVSEAFLFLHGHELSASDEEVVIVFRDLAAGELTEEMLAAWFRLHLVALAAK